MTASWLLGRTELETLFEELATELQVDGLRAEVLMVGGSWMLWYEMREATRDVDSAQTLSPEVAAAVARVAPRHDLDPDWLNDRAAPFMPLGFEVGTSTIVYEHAALVVRTPPASTIFLMKLYAGRAPDRDDLVKLWPVSRFSTPEEAVAAYERAYPHAPDDPHLIDFVAAISRAAG